MDVKRLMTETGCGAKECKRALLLCDDFCLAKEFLWLRYSGVARYHVTDGVRTPFSDDDYLAMARFNITQKEK